MVITINKITSIKTFRSIFSSCRIALACIALVLPLGACHVAVLGGAVYYGLLTQEEETNFIALHYAIADYMIHPAETYINMREDLIIVNPLVDTRNPGMSSILSKMIPERVGVRLSQLGYRIDLSPVKTASDTNYLKPVLYTREKPDFQLSGSYTRFEDQLMVTLHITNTRSGQVVSVHEYTLPLNNELEALSRPRPQIMRMGDGDNDRYYNGNRYNTSGEGDGIPERLTTERSRRAYQDYKAAEPK